MKRLLLLCALFFCANALFPAPQKEIFSVGNKTFLLNDKPILIKAAELHYTRIPMPYWEHRIQMCKAMGMNAICIYVFWNIHEQSPDKFDFKGQNDIAKFCRLAQKHGMYIIVRPGPYVCAEWEMGGLPWWLLKKSDVALRSNDPYFLERTEKYMKRLGKELAPLQITKGGNIIMVQVENEFGSYGTDKSYVTNIRDIVRRSGFDQVPLFQCDWSSNFKNNALDDLLWTINFGTGANIESQFKELSRLRPNTPLMCSEFWSGWFDHWGRKHETRPAEALMNGMKEMLERNISFSLYMAHGGTTFGQWGGANSPAYSAMCSSYDYDAPISEAGWTTKKYFLLRDLLNQYRDDKNVELPSVPESYPVITIPAIQLNQVAPLFENLPKAKFSETPLNMEQYDQGWGTILYRTTIPALTEPTRLIIDQPHDWTQVFVNGKKVATMDRRRGENSVLLQPSQNPAQLDILVEAMGRVNFNVAIHDRKGITKKVELVSEKKRQELKNWQVYNFPVDYKFSNDKRFKDGQAMQVPAYYKGTFKLDKVGDTFLDMRGWGKGMVWVNGHAMGRFWEIGPQQTLYMPGCWLKKGMNEIIVLDLLGTKQNTVQGLMKPILDQLGGEPPMTHRKRGENLNLTTEQPILTGAFNAGNGWQEVRFPETKMRYFCLEALSSQSGEAVAAIAELYLVGSDGKPLSREEWKIVYADSEETSAGNSTGDKIFDLQESTYWSTVFKGRNLPTYPHQIIIDLGGEYVVKGVRYLPRAEEKTPGMIKDFRLFGKTAPFVIEKK